MKDVALWGEVVPLEGASPVYENPWDLPLQGGWTGKGDLLPDNATPNEDLPSEALPASSGDAPASSNASEGKAADKDDPGDRRTRASDDYGRRPPFSCWGSRAQPYQSPLHQEEWEDWEEAGSQEGQPHSSNNTQWYRHRRHGWGQWDQSDNAWQKEEWKEDGWYS